VREGALIQAGVAVDHSDGDYGQTVRQREIGNISVERDNLY
jgi:hypothetical protein